MPSLATRQFAIHFCGHPFENVLNPGIEGVKKRSEGGKLDAAGGSVFRFHKEGPMNIK